MSRRVTLTIEDMDLLQSMIRQALEQAKTGIVLYPYNIASVQRLEQLKWKVSEPPTNKREAEAIKATGGDDE